MQKLIRNSIMNPKFLDRARSRCFLAVLASEIHLILVKVGKREGCEWNGGAKGPERNFIPSTCPADNAGVQIYD